MDLDVVRDAAKRLLQDEPDGGEVVGAIVATRTADGTMIVLSNGDTRGLVWKIREAIGQQGGD
jgi:hypothetical protein